MVKRKTIKIVDFLTKNLLDDGLAISKVILFGSQASGRATRESDIDIVIVSRDFHGKGIFQRAQLIKDAEIATIRKFMVPIDIILLTPEELNSRSSLIAGYARAGKVLRAA
jgi:predicted nucleotidyltransferase